VQFSIAISMMDLRTSKPSTEKNKAKMAARPKLSAPKLAGKVHGRLLEQALEGRNV
jgi:hypothetical protein